jgi:putative ABC transport system ATP-binding protein
MRIEPIRILDQVKSPHPQTRSHMLKIHQIHKSYTSGGRPLEVLAGVSATVGKGESLAIVGPSGSGKTTLLGICAGLDTPTSGEVELLGQPLSRLDEDARAAIRRRHVGFVFQNFQLIPTLTALENVCIPLELRGQRGVRDRAMEWLERVGLAGRAGHYPVQLSGGEQQRVALARASAADPAVLFADEPTGNLDGNTSAQIEDLLLSAHRENGNTLVLVTHDTELAARCDRVLRLRGGRVVGDATVS